MPPAAALETTVLICGGTVPVKVRYRTRYACNLWYDVFIEVIGDDPSTPNNELQDALNCSSGDLNLVMQQVTEQILIMNPMNFPPMTPATGCEENWRVMNGSCWAVTDKFQHVGPPPSENPVVNPADYGYDVWAMPCEGTLCCLERFEICIDPQGDRTITPGGFSPIGKIDDCPDDPNNPSEKCIPVCGSINR